MQLIKRDGRSEQYLPSKISTAMYKAFVGLGHSISSEQLDLLTKQVEQKIKAVAGSVSVETVQDFVETTLMEQGYYEVSKSYILYRNEHSKRRETRQRIMVAFGGFSMLDDTLRCIQTDFVLESYSLIRLEQKFLSLYNTQMSLQEKLKTLTKAAVELVSQDAPQWELIAARLLYMQFEQQLLNTMQHHRLQNFYEKISFLCDRKLYGRYILEHYTKQEIETATTFLDYSRNRLFTYAGLRLLLSRYVIQNHQGELLETPQEMFLGIALHLAMLETDNRLEWVKRFYDMLSTLKVTMATPTLSNARKPFHQLSSCFIDTVPDDLIGIYRSIDNFAQVSKYGGGMGLYFGKVRATGSTIRGFKGVAGGVMRWIKLANDTAVAVDQLGMRQGAVAVYLDAWHKDLPEFLTMRTNNGDDRMKAHDVFPGVCYPDLFWKMAKDRIDDSWYLMCPHEILSVKGYALEDFYGEQWEERYLCCVQDTRIHKRVVSVKELVRLILKSAVETGTPFVFNRDIVNRLNPNAHQGMIYCSNLCTEIAQNMSAIQSVSQTVQEIDGETVVVNVTKPGDFVVCNLASLSLGHINLEAPHELEELAQSAIRALDNVIDLNLFPVLYAKTGNERYRPIGLGVSGYHHMLAKRGIAWEKEEHLTFVDGVFERINFAAIEASCENAAQKGTYALFEGSDWQTGTYFDKRKYTDEKWTTLRQKVAKTGMRNGWLLAIAPTSSTSIIAGTTAGIDPIMNRFFLEEKKNGLMPRVAPDLDHKTFWLYKNAHLIDQNWSIRAAGVRQRHIDQAQSMNLYITNDYTLRQILSLYITAFECGVKSVYYIRSKSLEVEECDVCSS